MYTSRKVRRAVQEMSDEDFAFLMEDLDPEARAAAGEDGGRTDQAAALVQHYDEARTLGTLVDLIREITPTANL
ncbi:MAG: hypothetical protein ACI8PZ_006556 [Myxococcota bacterium]|jgi:hypothetical protein